MLINAQQIINLKLLFTTLYKKNPKSSVLGKEYNSEANIFEKDKAALIKRQTKVWGRGSRVYTEFGLLHE